MTYYLTLYTVNEDLVNAVIDATQKNAPRFSKIAESSKFRATPHSQVGFFTRDELALFCSGTPL